MECSSQELFSRIVQSISRFSNTFSMFHENEYHHSENIEKENTWSVKNFIKLSISLQRKKKVKVCLDGDFSKEKGESIRIRKM